MNITLRIPRLHNNWRISALLSTTLLFVLSIQSFGQIGLPHPGQRKDSPTVLIDTINCARSAYQIELLAVSTYEAALNTPYLKDEAKSRAQHFYEDHKKHANTLLEMLDQLGGKSDDIKQIKKNYNWLESEKDVIDHLIKAEENSEKELSSDAKKTKNQGAKKTFEQLRDDERTHIKAYEPLRKAATK